jgi:predicted dehydrogenase
MTVSVAIVGAGSIGQKHARAAKAAGACVRYVIDSDQQRAKTLADEFGAAHATDACAALGDPAIDAIVVCVPNCFHKGLTIDALQAGRHVLLEKPMALNESECQEVNDVAEATGRVLQLAFVHRYTGVGQVAKQIVAAGTLGEVYHAKAHLHFRRGVPGLGKWFTNKRLSGGGALIDVGVHLVDLAMHVLDFPEVEIVTGQVYAKFGQKMGRYVYENMWSGPPDLQGTFDVEDSAHAFLRFANGATLDLQVAWAGNYPEKNVPTSMMGFFGERGGIAFELFGDHVNHSFEEGGALVDQRLAVPDNDPFRDQFADFLNGIDRGACCGPTGLQGQIDQSIVDAIYHSSVLSGVGAAV